MHNVLLLVLVVFLFINSEVQWFSTKANLSLKGQLAMSAENFGCHN